MKSNHIVLICGRYEGVDERVNDALVTDEISIGDYVLSGGEPAAIVLTDAIVRLLPNALGSETSAVNDSFSERIYWIIRITRSRAIFAEWKFPKFFERQSRRDRKMAQAKSV